MIENVKIYHDGSHYIGVVPGLGCPRSGKKAPTSATVQVLEDCEDGSKHFYKITHKELFERTYRASQSFSRKERKRYTFTQMRAHFKSDSDTNLFIQNQVARKMKNLAARRKRLVRKVFMTGFDYFCTFTYDSNKHSEATFKKRLQRKFKDLVYRNGWRYLGVWERSPDEKRLHFHGLFNIPPGELPGVLFEVEDWSVKKHRMQKTLQNSYFNEHFGRSDFRPIENDVHLRESINYLLKYIEKTGERIVYSHGLPEFFVSDIKSEDVVTHLYNVTDKRLILCDDFDCIIEGEEIGKVCEEVIEQMPKIL